ncbi:hypothetical protein WMY93_021953 [Mugilogobius chulae]|uniref:L1 transposable element RRM domain-containing protein n=1 Tax=Mugilogobius chulae TaxID=88201 RepID=A0AAW0MDC8_9GOBI
MPIKGQKNAQKTQKSDSPVQQANEGAMLTADASEANQASVSSELVSHPDVMSAIKSMQTDFASRFDSLLNAIRGVQNEIQLIATRVSQTEDRIGNNEDDIATLKKDNCTLKGELEALTRKVDDLENRSRRSNLRLVGLPEKAEGRDMCSFLVKWIPEVLGTVSFPGPLIIERAHRIGRPPEADSAATGPAPRPRAVVMKFLNYADKTRVMRAAREMGTVLYEGKKVMFFPDISSELLKQRKTYDPVKKLLASFSIPDLRFGIIHPAKLLVTHKGKRHVFDNASQANVFAQQFKEEGGYP